MIGTTVSHYRILDQIGSGGMGVVYRAQDTRLGRLVALKFLAGVSKQAEQVERFQREARIASALNHPHICTIHDVGTHEGHPFIVMELLEGETLKNVIGRRPLQTELLVDIAVQVADALGAAHARGVIHRDIKPSNIFVSGRGQAKVLDFGLAKASVEVLPDADGDVEAPTGVSMDPANITIPGTPLGTVAYMSPEQARGEKLDARSDLFSFGAVLYEMATGCQPFPANTMPLVFDAILNRSAPAPVSLRPSLPPDLDRVIRKALEKDRSARYQDAAELRNDLEQARARLAGASTPSGYAMPTSSGSGAAFSASDAPTLSGDGAVRRRRATRLRLAAGAAVLVALAAAAVLLWRNSRVPGLTERDSIVLADFVNTTGENVYDGTLKQALVVQLGQSPYLDIVSDAKVRETLAYMGRSPNEPVTAAVGREICARLSVKALLEGSIAKIGSHYAVTLTALNSETGDVIALEQVEANSQEKVLQSLGGAATALRRKLGESLGSIQKYDVPIAEATTPSLEALRAYTLGARERNRGKELESIPFFVRAIELDANFASAYNALSAVYGNIGEYDRTEEYARLAFERRERVSEREKLGIAYQYYNRVTGDLERAAATLELWKHSYPRDYTPANALANLYNRTGQFDRAVPEGQEAQRRDPSVPYPYSNLAFAYRGLNQFGAAKAAADQAVSRRIETAPTRRLLYQIALLEGDQAAAERHASWAAGKPREHDMTAGRAQVAAFGGRLHEARNLYHQARKQAESGNFREVAAMIGVSEALVELALLNYDRAREISREALAQAPSRISRARAFTALPLSATGAPEGEEIVGELVRLHPDDTLLRTIFLPVTQAARALKRGEPQRTLEVLEVSRLYELGPMPFWAPYLRGLAHLARRSGADASREFEVIVNHRGADPFSPLWALAHLGLGRAQALQGHDDLSRKAYEKFLELWRDADPDLPLLRSARDEHGAPRSAARR